jgi:RNA polymerase sigma-70 factor (sigma-E family)
LFRSARAGREEGDGVASDVEFDEFVAARSAALLRTAYLLTRDVQLAEDLLQTALAKAWFSWKRIDGDPEPYVRRILVNASVSWWRKRWTHETPTGFVPEPTPGAGSPADVHDLMQALGRLPRRQRAVVVLRYVEDRTEADTAALMGCSVGTVKSQCAKALAKLRGDVALDVAADERSAL